MRLLREEGFALAQADRPVACRYGAERFVRGTATVIHLRPHLPMMPTERSGLNWERWDVPCLQALGAGGDTPVLVAGWMEVGHPWAALTAPGVTPLFVPQRGTGPAAALEDRRYALLLARAPASLVPSLLEPASDPLARRLALEAAASAERPGPENPFADRIENKIISRSAR